MDVRYMIGKLGLLARDWTGRFLTLCQRKEALGLFWNGILRFPIQLLVQELTQKSMGLL